MNKIHKSRPNHQIIKSFEAKAMRKRNSTQKMADWMTHFFGSVEFLVINIGIFIFWIVANRGYVPGIPIFDPFPHVLLITTVSLEAIILAIVVLMSQNRQAHTATLRDELQLQVELISEKEISKALMLLNEILEKKGVNLTDKELEEMINAIDTSYIEKKLVEQLTGKRVKSSKKV